MLLCCLAHLFSFFFFFNDTATTEIYTLSLHDALPISPPPTRSRHARPPNRVCRRIGTTSAPRCTAPGRTARDRKSTRLNSSHGYISYAVFCLKKKKDRQSLGSHANNQNSSHGAVAPR